MPGDRRPWSRATAAEWMQNPPGGPGARVPVSPNDRHDSLAANHTGTTPARLPLHPIRTLAYCCRDTIGAVALVASPCCVTRSTAAEKNVYAALGAGDPRSLPGSSPSPSPHYSFAWPLLRLHPRSMSISELTTAPGMARTRVASE